MILLLILISFPACNVSFPPFPELLFAINSSVNVISLFACKVTSVPAFNRAKILFVDTCELADGLFANVALATLSKVFVVVVPSII